MHLSVRQSQALDAADDPVNPDQSPADILYLSFTDSDLACMAAACRRAPDGASLRLTNLARLKHPLSVDLYLEQVAVRARVIVARILGGLDWWRYGAEELARIARERNIGLILIPGDARRDDRLGDLSTADSTLVGAVDACLAQGGIDNAARVLACLQQLARGENPPAPEPVVTENAALYRRVHPLSQPSLRGGEGFDAGTRRLPLLHGGRNGERGRTGSPPAALILFYRAHYFAADTAPIDALLDALAARGLTARAMMAASLKDPAALAVLRGDLQSAPVDIILDATAFAAGEAAHPLAGHGAPVLQIALANTMFDAWQSSPRGLGPSDLAMHVVLPESDGRIFTRAISFKREGDLDPLTESRPIVHAPVPDRVDFAAELAAKWVRLGKMPAARRRVGLILSDYPGHAGRGAFAVGLDGPQSAAAILRLLAARGYNLADPPETGADLLAALTSQQKLYDLAAYKTRLAQLPPGQQQELLTAWGAPEQDECCRDGAFHLRVLTCGNITLALQPDRGSALDRKSAYHDPALPPRHAYLAFYWWLRDAAKIDAMIHLGTHGNLEWLPGKSAALSAACWPDIVLGAMPVIYPYIVSDPGEAAQAKRRIAALTLGHLTPPLMPVSLSPQLAELEMLIDEFGGADGLDGRRMKLLRAGIIDRARAAGLPGADNAQDEDELMSALETHLCDIKEQRVGDGLHIFGRAPQPDQLRGMAEALHEISGGAADPAAIAESLAASAQNECAALLAALDGKFIMPGPGGSPVRGRLDILPTGRNMISIDPRAIPTRTAAVIGARAAGEFVRRYAQDHGDWPKSVMIDVWGSATLRNGGDEIAQALHLMGVAPGWDAATHRVCGFDIIPTAAMDRPRIDVSLRISGLFRDMFAGLITLFDDAVRAVAALDEPADLNPLAAAARGRTGADLRAATWRIFGNAPGVYGSGMTDLIDRGAWTHKNELGQAWIDASHYAYGRDADGLPRPAELKSRVEAADALIHMQDQRETDVLSGADFADAEGGFAAAAALLGRDPALYHMDATRPQSIKARSLAEEISLTLQARALNASWIAGQMRHGYAGAAALADVVDNLFAFAAASGQVGHAQFDAVFAAYLDDAAVRDFLAAANPEALRAMTARLAEALQRGLWTPRRNSVHVRLAAMRDGKPQASVA